MLSAYMMTLPRHVAGGAADGLDERAVVAQEALLVGVEDGHERDLGQVQALAQQVDAHEHVERALAQLAQDLDAVAAWRCPSACNATLTPLVEQVGR